MEGVVSVRDITHINTKQRRQNMYTYGHSQVCDGFKSGIMRSFSVTSTMASDGAGWRRWYEKL